MLETSLNIAHAAPVSGIVEAELGDRACLRGAGLTVFRRSLPGELVRWVESLPVKNLPSFRILVRTVDLPRALDDAHLFGALEDSPARQMLAKDIATQARFFGEAAKSEWVDLRLEAIHGNACWKFHRDFVSRRLLTTYRGPGTQWVQPSHAEAALRQQHRYKGPIEVAPAHAVLLFQNLLNQDEAAGIVHRSPAIAHSKQTRLLLCLNERGAWSPQPWRT